MRTYVPFLLLLFVIAAVLRVDFYFTIAYLFFAVYLLARVWTRHSVTHLEFRRQFTPRAFYGDRVDVALDVRNTGRLPVLWLQVREALPVELATPPHAQLAFSLAPRERRRYRYALECRRRGVYAVGPLAARTGDALGTADSPPLECPPDSLIVYPQVVPLERLGLPTRSPLAALPAPAPLFEDPARVTGVREYHRGDSPRRIHWSASAHTGTLLVKQYQPAIARDTLICLDLDEASYGLQQRYDASELAIVAAASIANHVVVRERLGAGLAAETWDARAKRATRVWLPPRRERAHLMNVLEALARAELGPATPFHELLRRAGLGLAWGTTIVAVTPRPSDELLHSLAALRRSGYAVAAVLVRPERSPAAWERRAAGLGVRAWSVWRERDVAGGAPA